MEVAGLRVLALLNTKKSVTLNNGNKYYATETVLNQTTIYIIVILLNLKERINKS